MLFVIICIVGIIYFSYKYKKKDQEKLPPKPPMPTIDSPNNCPYCGGELTEDMIYCENCGRIVNKNAK